MDLRCDPETPVLCVGAVLQGKSVTVEPAGVSSISKDSLSKVSGSTKPSTEASSVEEAVDTVVGVPNAENGSLPLVAFCSVLAANSTGIGWIEGLAVVIAANAAERPSSSRSFPSEFLAVDSIVLSILTEASCIVHGLELSELVYPIAALSR